MKQKMTRFLNHENLENQLILLRKNHMISSNLPTKIREEPFCLMIRSNAKALRLGVSLDLCSSDDCFQSSLKWSFVEFPLPQLFATSYGKGLLRLPPFYAEGLLIYICNF